MARTLLLRNRADTSQRLVLHYDRVGASGLLLQGLNEQKDSISVLLNKIERQYPLVEGRHERKYIAY